MTDDQMQHTTQVRQSFSKIPHEKRQRMIARTIWGVGFIAFGVAIGMGKLFAGLPVLIAFATVIFGAVMASGQLTMHPFRLFVAYLRDLRSAWKEPTP